MKKNPTPIAVASRSFSKHPVLRAELLERYENIRFNDSGKVLSGDELVEFLKDQEKAITGLEKINDAILSRLPKLKTIGKYGVGLDMIDFDSLKRHGVKLGWTPGVNKRSVAELTLSFMITLLHHAAQSYCEVREGKWRQLYGTQLTGKTVGIIGCGNVGKDLVELLKPFGCRILVHDIVDYADFYQKHGIEKATLLDLLKSSDIVTIHVPLNGTTRRMLSADRLALLKPTAILINCARGGLVDEPALKALLQTGKLFGAAFDVFESEPPTDLELIRLPNFFCTGHIGGSSEEAVLAMGRAAIAGLDNATDPDVFRVYC